MRYYFDLIDNYGIAIDEEGLDLSSIERVREEAARSLGDIARDEVRRLSDTIPRELTVRVRDDTGPVLYLKFTFEVGRLLNSIDRVRTGPA
jgi:hypothetical protein